MAVRPLISAAAGVLLIAAILAIVFADTWSGDSAGSRETVVIKGNTFHLDVVANDATRALGLGGVTSIEKAGGMLFVFDVAAIQSFWMKDCVVNIDLIFLDARGFVTALHRMPAVELQGAAETDLQYEARVRRAGEYNSSVPALFAIELQSGWLDRLQLRVGDKIDLETMALRKRTG